MTHAVYFSSLIVIFGVVLGVLVEAQALASNGQRREPRCPLPPAEGWPEPPGPCTFGIVRDVCGKPSCAMGPGEPCKYKRFLVSNCGEGTFCHCSRCMGCSLHSYTCYETTCVFAMSTK